MKLWLDVERVNSFTSLLHFIPKQIHFQLLGKSVSQDVTLTRRFALKKLSLS